MGTISPFLRMTLQGFNENVDTWGDILNASALECLEDAISGVGTVDVTAGNITLADTEGGPSPETGTAHSRWAIINVIGSPGATNDVITPARSKIYLVANNTGDSSAVQIIPTGGGTGITVPNGVAQYVYCDGTNMLAIDAATATQATTAAAALDAAQLDGVAASGYAQKGVAQVYTKGQVTQRDASLVTTTGQLTIDVSESNSFYLLTTESFTLNAPTNATNGQQFSLAIQQGGGGSHTIGFQSGRFVGADGSTPVLSTAPGAIDYLGFEYITNLQPPFDTPTANRWVVSILKNLEAI